jgi:hypothetical protein
MTYISKHYSKEEWISDDVKGSRIDLLVSRFAISLNNFMEGPDEVIYFEMGRRLEFVT